MVSTTQRERSDRCGVPDPTHNTASERLTVTRSNAIPQVKYPMTQNPLLRFVFSKSAPAAST